MSMYNIGDVVSLVVDNPDCNDSLHIGDVGVVVGLDDEWDAIRVDWGRNIDGHDCGGLCPAGRGWSVNEDEISLYTFRVGDRVQAFPRERIGGSVLTSLYGIDDVEVLGTICGVEDRGLVAVRWDKPFGSGHNCDGLCETGFGWYCLTNTIMLADKASDIALWRNNSAGFDLLISFLGGGDSG